MVRFFIDPGLQAFVLTLAALLAGVSLWRLLDRSGRKFAKVIVLGVIWCLATRAIIQSGASSDLWTIDATAKAGRVTLYNTDGTAVSESATYRAADKAATLVASATSPYLVLQGSATKTIKVTRIRFSASAATGSTGGDFWVMKFTAISGGTFRSAPPAAKADSADGSSTGQPQAFSVVPSTATPADGGSSFWSSTRYVILTGAATGPSPAVLDMEYGTNGYGRPMVLRGTGQYLGIGISAIGTTPIGNTVIEWVEY